MCFESSISIAHDATEWHEAFCAELVLAPYFLSEKNATPKSVPSFNKHHEVHIALQVAGIVQVK